MKIVSDIDSKDNVAQEQQVVEKKQKHVFSVKHKHGLTLFECNVGTRVIQKAEMETYFDAGKKKEIRRVKQKENTLYVEALNLKNAKKKFIAQIKSMIEYGKNKSIQRGGDKKEQSTSSSQA